MIDTVHHTMLNQQKTEEYRTTVGADQLLTPLIALKLFSVFRVPIHNVGNNEDTTCSSENVSSLKSFPQFQKDDNRLWVSFLYLENFLWLYVFKM